MKAYETCHDPFLRYCSALCYGKMDTEDLVQDVLLSAYQHFDTIKQKGQLLHYLIRSARNRSISRWRRSKFKSEWLEKHAEQLIAKGISPEMSLDIQLLHKTLDKLPTKQKEAVLLFEVSGFSMKEIAVIQDSTEGAVKTKISRARKRLRELMQEKPTKHAVVGILETIQTVLL